ncbi:hypothetical protein [Staphylococcus chromogenes]|uniref:hypothetical protein n=1 Tax=Staphylococcus chromogenes TaxID=46126 RepID=UPI0028860568|nr:hypothetical protein [Staphylococcus chromogenes]MDT0697293.1 hypothetical protein [Staphylococcus chromogenes]MDU0479941.1 hypothetical protein [Staphylococcus chromogenes]
MYKVKYSSFNYYPDTLLISNIAVGVIFQIENNNNYYENRFNLMQRKSKLFNFDEELNPEFTKIFLNGIRDNFIKFKGEIKEFTRFYVNNFKFTNIQIREFNSLDEVNIFINDTTRYILHPSQNPKNKMTEKEKKEYINNYLSKKFNTVQKSYVFQGGKNQDKITVDFMVETKNGKKIGYKVVNKSPQAIFNIRSYIAHAMFNEENITFILDDNMEKEREFIFDLKDQINKESEINAVLEKDLVTQ